ncbi:hypothetical protein KY342_03365 [Candidatus Woesearchaeota archaeon]|nr:hypothetical protein [Candidatus Woesearchaeota archaeon]
MLNLTHLSEAWRIFKRSRYVKKHGVKKYRGNAERICKQIVKDCWNGRYFQVSTGHFNEFYVRDFGWCIDSLLKLGYKKEVKKTLEYAIDIYSKQGLKTTITSNGKTVDVFTYAPDSLAFLVRSLRVLGDKDLVKKYKDFLIKEIDKFYDLVVDKETGLVRSDRYFSSIKDEAKRRSSCYDNSMVAMLNNELIKLNFHNPLKKYNFKKTIKHMFWNESYFVDSLRGDKEIVTGDANIFPFWTEVFDDKEMLKNAIEQIQLNKLDQPFPLRYSYSKNHNQKMNFVEKFVPNYERDTCWMHMGLLYIQLVKQIDKEKAQEYKMKYKELIEKYHNFLEVFNPDGTPFKSRFYYADEGMLWTANYLFL